MPLKRSPLTRKTPLARGGRITGNPRVPLATEERDYPKLDLAAAARALSNQAASAALPPRQYAPVPDVSQPAPRPSNTGFPAVVRQTILDRDHMRCQRCGRPIDGDSWLGYSLQHRDNRSMGGTRDPRINLPSNGVTLCGSATTGCHEWAEDNETEAAAEGFVVKSYADPETVPVKTFAGWVLLDNRGGANPTTEPPGGDAHARAQRKRPL